VDNYALTKIENLARETNSTVFTVVVSAIFLAIYSCEENSPEILLACTLSTRMSIAQQEAAGSFLNSLLLRTRIDENKCVFDFLKEIHTAINLIKHNCICSVSRMWKELGHSEFINLPVNINYFVNPDKVVFDEVRKQSGIHKVQKAPYTFDIDIKAIQGTDGILLYYNYKNELFTEECIENFTRRVEDFLNRMTSSQYLSLSYILGTGADVI
jgi:hypothetical protein